MTKTIRPYEIDRAAERRFSAKFQQLKAQVDFLITRVGQLERRIGISPVEVDQSSPVGDILKERGQPHAKEIGKMREEGEGKE